MNNILEKMDSDKEVLSTYPKNNKKNYAKYMEDVDVLRKEYLNYKDEVFSEMKKRYEKVLNIKQSDEIAKTKIEINDLANMLDIIENVKSSYEKMGMDKIIYKLGKFYKENLDNVNDEIFNCINKFKEVGINLSPENFDYSIYVEEYMTTFLSEAQKGDVNSDIVKNKFEQIYWKCPDIIIHIELNLRYIYLEKQNIIDKYYEKRKNDLLTTLNSNQKKLNDKYDELNKKMIKLQSTDKAIIIDKFFDGKLNVKDYEKEKIDGDCKRIFSEDILENNDTEEMYENVVKFINSLYEYKNYEKFKFIFTDIKKKYTEKEQHKNEYNTIRKEISKKEKKLKSLNNKINGKSLFGKKKEKLDKQNAEYNKLIIDIKADYKRLDEAEMYSKINDYISDDSTIYDTLKFATCFNNYLVDCIIDNNKSITNEEMDEFISELKDFLINPNNTIIKNITIVEEKDIPIIISDRYKLLNFNVAKEDISIANVDGLIAVLEHIENKHNMDKDDIKLDDMKFVCEFKKILEKNK